MTVEFIESILELYVLIGLTAVAEPAGEEAQTVQWVSIQQAVRPAPHQPAIIVIIIVILVSTGAFVCDCLDAR